jgi:alanyl aminopeptidase
VWGDEAGIHRQCFLLSKPADRFQLSDAKGCPAWLFADSNASGYYAIAYDSELAGKLMSNGLTQLSPAESAAALRNIQLMLGAGLGDPEQQLRFIAEFSHSADPGLVRQAAATFKGLSDFVPDNLRANYARAIHALYGERARELGWQPKPDESQDTRLLRMQIVPLVANDGGDHQLAGDATALANQWLKDRQGLDTDMVEPILSTAAFNGDRTFYDRLVNQLENDKVQRERSMMIGALDSFRQPELTQARLDLILSSKIDPRELQYTLFGAAPDAREIVWEFVQKNFDRLNSTIAGARGIPFGALLPLTASGFCDEASALQVDNFFRPKLPSLPGAERNFNNTLERIHLCIARSAAIKPALVKYLSVQ